MIASDDLGPLFSAKDAEELERVDRENPIPGSEPACPICENRLLRVVEAHPAPRTDDSPFRVRLVCTNDDCGRWTVYDW